MADIKHPRDIKYAEAGDNSISASGYNGLISSAQRVEDMRRGVYNEQDISGGKDTSSDMLWMNALAHEDIPEYSIFTVKEGGDGWTLVEANPQTAQIDVDTEGACVYLTNEEDPLYANTYGYLPVCALHKPFIFRYEAAGGTPKIGDSIGPKLGTYSMSLASELMGFTVVSSPDMDNFLVWCIKVACGSGFASSIPMFEFTEELYPGYVANARKLKWDPATTTYILDPNDQKQYKLYDPEEQNFFLPKERVHGIKKPLRDAQSAIFADYEIVGEHGLRRKVRVEGDVECGDVGEGLIQEIQGFDRAHPPPKYPDDPVCLTNTSLTSVRACNRYGYRRKILDQEFHGVYYDHGRQAFIFEQEDRANDIEATLGADLCPDDATATIEAGTAKFQDWLRNGCFQTPDPDILEAVSNLGLSGKAQDTLILRREEGQTGNAEWKVRQVQHKSRTIVLDVVDEQGACLGIQFLEKTSIMSCLDPDSKAFGTEVPLLVDIRAGEQGSCEMKKDYLDVCVLKVAGARTVPWPLTETEVITGVKSPQWTHEEPTPSDPKDDICKLNLLTAKVCTFGYIGPGEEDIFVEFRYTEVANAVADASGNCVELTKKYIPVPGCDDQASSNTDTIYCTVDCEDTPTTVLSEALAPGTYTPVNKQTQPYENTGLNDGDIIVQFPSDSIEGEIIAVVNNGMSDVAVTIDGNGHNVQAMEAPYTMASVNVRGPKLSITWQLRLIGGINLEWRIF
jgi:hypothetical protein